MTWLYDMIDDEEPRQTLGWNVIIYWRSFFLDPCEIAMNIHNRPGRNLLVAILGTLLAVQSAVIANDDIDSEDVWSRTHRVFAYDAPRRARYPSVALNSDGDLVMLFTHVTEDQEKSGTGDVMMIRSKDQGENWTAPTKIYEGDGGEPRTNGSLTKLASGKLVAASVEVDQDEHPQMVRLLSSSDGGQSWEVGDSLTFSGVKRESPSGRIMEQSDGQLLMPISGSQLGNDGKDAPCVGLVRSSDGGRSWNDFSLIATGYDQPAVLSTGAKSLVAIVHRDETLYRCRSKDGGLHWTNPEQVLSGRQPHLVRINQQAVACVGAVGPSNYGTMWVAFSYDNAQTWRCERTVMAYRGPAAHWGWPAAMALDADNLCLAISRTQLPSATVEGPAPKPVTVEQERVEVVFFQRDSDGADISLAEKITPPEARDHWEFVRNFTNNDRPHQVCRLSNGELIGVKEVGDSLFNVWDGPGKGGASAAKYISAPAATPKKVMRSKDNGRTWTSHPMIGTEHMRGGPGLVTQLSSGRLLCTIVEWLLVEWNYEAHKVIGQEGGYTVWNPDHRSFHVNLLTVLRSDDNGKTWQGRDEPMNIDNWQWAIPNARFIERSDGTVVLPVFGCVNEQDGYERLDSIGLYRSTDGGETWGDYSEIAYDKEKRWYAYNEMDIAVVREDLWVAFIRSEPRRYGSYHSWLSRAISTDGGYTWTRPELSFTHSVPDCELLPDGGIVLGVSGGLHFTYDLGRTWTRVIPFSGYASPTLVDENTLWVANSQAAGSYQEYRRVPGGVKR